MGKKQNLCCEMKQTQFIKMLSGIYKIIVDSWEVSHQCIWSLYESSLSMKESENSE